MNTKERKRRLEQERLEAERLEAEQLEYERQRLEQELKKLKELAELKSPHFAIALGPAFLMKYVHPAYKSPAGFLYLNWEFASVANGHLHFGLDADIGILSIDEKKVVNLDEKDSTDAGWFRGGASTKLFFFDGMYGPYLTAGAGWSYFGDRGYNLDSYSGPSFSVGAGLYFLMFIDARYFVMPTNGRNAGYIALNFGISLPTSGLAKQSAKERKRK